MNRKIEIILKNSDNLPIGTDIYSGGEHQKRKPFIIFCHGFKGFKDWGGFPYMLERFSKYGFISAGFNFSHNGVTSEAPMDFTRLDLFAKNTISKELDDLNCVIDYFYKNSILYNIDKDKIALIGHSRGGGTSLIKASEDKRIKAIVTLASIAKFDRYTDKIKKEWREKGYIEIPNYRTGQIMRMNVDYLNDLEKNNFRLDIYRAVRNLTIPLLIIHGREDLSVKFTDAEKIYECSDKMISELVILDSTGHTFGTEHPFKGTTAVFDKVIELIVKFLDKCFK
ncbi:MAG: alpha/beta fold hydrolase [Ignavibacteria bacterium]|nr:alpha/beta fold hydrolase [Ignavibacteria bacterium]